MTAQQDATKEGVHPDVLKAVIEAYYSDAIRGGTQARSRAAAAQSLCTLFVGALIGLVSFYGHIDAAPFAVVLGLVSAASWVLVSLLYLRAVASPIKTNEETRAVNSGDQLVRIILQRARAERDEIDKRQAVANRSLVGAVALTAAALLAIVLAQSSAQWTDIMWDPTAEHTRAIREICPVVAGPAHAKLNVHTIGQETLEIQLTCGDSSKSIELDPSALKQMVILNDG